ncbi:hypothetical protein ACIP1T_27520 [Pseudomonas japonica]|uniref:hypothetical protein n=1 Tax=Pseudomonas japonica TaxID=256466 RepID=UPI00382F77D6
MAGHFILRNIALMDLFAAQSPPLAAIKGVTQHANIGWGITPRTALRNALSGANIGDRSQLPPHFYLMISNVVGQPDRERYLRVCGWGESLERPAAPGLGLRALTPAAAAAFAAGNPNDALALQALHGNVSVEIYYMAKTEVDGARSMELSLSP